jgi:ubiquinone/menaquinone biosynthesis C-methylase UbiE/uncharacterized protein YbaR (Trm112 family)
MMVNWLDFLRCPHTGSELKLEEGYLVSQQGGYRYPIVFGIPDLRLFDPPYMSRAEELQVTEKLDEASKKMDYKQMVEYFEANLLGNRDEQKIAKGITHRLALRERSPNRLGQLLAQGNGLKPSGKILDLGCGSGEAIARLIDLGGESVIGMDISLTELKLAQKLLEEAGISACLVAACAEAMPFCSDYFDFVYSPDVIEHVSDQGRYLDEIYRILTQDGKVLLNSPNRYSLVCPEPHVGIWGLTFLPRPWIDPVCRLLGKGSYIGKRLVSLVELRLLISKKFSNFEILSRRSNPMAESLMGRLYYLFSPRAEKLFAYVADQHVVIARKECTCAGEQSDF